jgi:hypothetical protein
VNVVIKINGREAIPVRALPLLAEWGTMHPQKIAGALGRVTDDDCRPLFYHLHDMNAFYVEDGAVYPVEEHHWRDHIYRNLQTLSDTIRHTEITRETGHSEWRVKALGVLPKDAFVWRDEYELIYDGTYGIGSRTRESGDSHNPPVLSKSKPPGALNFSPFVEVDMQPPVQAALDAIGRATGTPSKTINDVTEGTSNAVPVEELPLPQTQTATPAPVVAVGAFGGTTRIWTDERINAARAMLNEQRGRGIKAFAANTAAAFGVSATRLREVLNGKSKKAPAKKGKGVWGV